MPLILFHELKADLGKPTIIEVEHGSNLMDCIETYFPMGFGCDVEMHWNAVGEFPFFKSEWVDSANLEIDINQNLHIVCRPQGIETLFYIAVAAVAASVIVATTIDVPPNDAGNVKQSPNNQLNAQTNIARSGQAIPYIVGRVRSYPDLISEPVLEFVNNRLVITEQFLIGIGSHLLEDSRQAEASIDDIDGSTVEFFQPGEFPTEAPLESFNAINIDGQTVFAPNEEGLNGDTAATTAGNISAFSSRQIGFSVPYDDDWNELASKTLPYNIEVEYLRNSVVITPNPIGGEPEPEDRLFAAIGSGSLDSAVIVNDEFGDPESINFIVGDFTGLQGEDPVDGSPRYGTNITATERLNEAIGPFPTSASSDQIWFNFEFTRGLVGTAVVQIDLQQIDSNGDPIAGTEETVTESFADNDFNPQYRTIKITPTGGTSRYQFTLTRTNNSNLNASRPDTVQIGRVQSIRETSVTTYGDVTWAILTTRAISEAATQSQRNFNVLATRMTKTYDNGAIVDTLSPSRTGSDSILQIFVDSGRNPQTEVNLDELYAIYDPLPDERLGYCDFTFDDEDISLRQRIDTVCSASRVSAYRAGQTWEFDRDELKPFVSFSFNRRNMSSQRSQGQTWRGHLPNTANSVELKWRDIEVDNKEKFIYLVINPTTQTIDTVDDIGFNRPKRLEIAGITNEYQAINRAQLEVRKLLYERISVKDTILSDAYNVGIGQIGYWADVYERTINDGEILGYSEGLVDSSERITLDDSDTNFVTITNDLGEPEGRVVATARSDTEFGFTATLDGVTLADLSSVQLGSRYILSTETRLDESLFRMLGKTPREGSEGQLLVDVEMIQYDVRVYEFDEVQ
ncbi:hypothetical protein NVP1247A_28 [Vibrio phage 1.247.A._10N.261.54.E12]|nr:hypothetical protein NVP1247A_28 [Vibrio phage 1.247.A._10N.261.54.E12]AUR98172.1 hypothetical protein NVP1247B_28 [Vibrio phage 1.247.B._10N.261.54.E12]